MPKIINAVLLLTTAILVNIGHAQPKVELGIKASRCYDGDVQYYSSSFSDSIEVESYIDYYTGFNAEILIGFFKYTYLRMELVQYQKFDYESGGKIGLFSEPGADLIIDMPLKGRIVPSIYGGIKYIMYFNLPGNDRRSLSNPYYIDAGLGIHYKLKSNLKIFSEIQLYSKYLVDPRRHPHGEITWHGSELIGLARFNLGVRFGL